MKDNVQIAVYMVEEDAKKFILFQQHYDMFQLMLEKGVFNQKNAAVTLHFDQNGVLQTIQRADFLFSLKHDK